MKTEKDNTHLVDEYLESLQGMQQAEPRPFFYTRLKSRLENNKQPQVHGFNVRPVFVICTLFVFLMINFWMINTQKGSKEQKPAPTSVSSLSGFADTYNFTVSSY